ncbi:hypothetical protein, partial [Acinetobacter baumannii]
FCIGFLILYSSNMYGDEIYLCNKAIYNAKNLPQKIIKSIKIHNNNFINRYNLPYQDYSSQ